MSSRSPLIPNIKLIWEIPFAFLSFIFYKVAKFVIGSIYAVYLSRNKETTRRWRVLSAETLKNPIALPVIMTKGPRWNTHAIVASVGPFVVKKALAVDVASTQKSAKSWTVVVYAYPSYQTVANLGTLSSACQESWESVELSPGQYTLVLRYYEWGNIVELPTIKIDDRAAIESQTISKDTNNFLFDLKENKNCLYLALHYYVFTILRLRHRLPDSFVRREFLPVGDRDNQFGYGYLYQGERLRTEIDAAVLESYDVYLTLYNRSSFPTAWYQITQTAHASEPSPTDGFYLLRFRQKSRHQSTLSLEYDELRDSELAKSNESCCHVLRVRL